MNRVAQEVIPTLPAMPAAIKKNHRPTLAFKMPVEVQEEKAKRNAGRYSIIRPDVNDS